MLKQKKIVKILCAGLILSSYLNAKTLVNGISVLVNNEPITLYEIHKLSKQENVPLKEALNILIQKRLEDSQVKRLGIKASSYEITKEIGEIAKKNGLTSKELIDFVFSKGMNERDYRDTIAKGIKARKLYNRIFKNKNAAPTEAEIKAYYKAHPTQFSQSSTFKVTTYFAETKLAIEKVMASPMSVVPGVRLKQEVLNSANLDKRMLYYLNQTKKGSFTPISQFDNGYVAFLVDDKIGLNPKSFEEAKPLIVSQLSKQKQEKAVDNYFDKLKSDANIEVLRKP